MKSLDDSGAMTPRYGDDIAPQYRRCSTTKVSKRKSRNTGSLVNSCRLHHESLAKAPDHGVHSCALWLLDVLEQTESALVTLICEHFCAQRHRCSLLDDNIAAPPTYWFGPLQREDGLLFGAASHWAYAESSSSDFHSRRPQARFSKHWRVEDLRSAARTLAAS